MNYTIPAAEAQIQFLQHLQRLLEEGKFTSTYKFALLLSLVDLAVEKGADTGEPLEISVHDIAEKMIRFYWDQAIPYPAHDGEGSILFQNNNQQAAVINKVTEARDQYGGSLAQIMSNTDQWHSLVRRIARTVQEMPLWKLQVINNQVDDFLYAHTDSKISIILRHGVSYNLRTFHGQIHNMVQGAWVRWLRKATRNQSILGQSVDLHEFLFGNERSSLRHYVPILKELQNGHCFYCDANMYQFEVDHFIPWIRYPVDLGHNFVLAHKSCNNSKHDYLAAEFHLEKWLKRNNNHKDIMISYFDEQDLTHDMETTQKIALWAYQRVSATNGHVWMSQEDGIRPLGDDWEKMM